MMTEKKGDRSAINQANALPVWILHGFAASPIWVRPLAKKLQRLGWNAQCYRYPSWVSSIEREGERFADFLKKQYQRDSKPIHLIGHSMGGLVARVAINHLPSDAIGKLVMICTPNQGSHIASRVHRWLGPFFPMLSQMSDEQGSFVKRLPPPKVPYAIVAADGDLVVRPDSTRVSGDEPWLRVPGMHSAAVWRDDVAKAVDSFLRNGKLT